MASKNGQAAVLTAALSSGTKLELNCVQADQNVDIVDKKKAVSVYKLVRLGEYQRSWGFQLHLSNRMFDASSGRGSEVLRVLRDQANGTIELVGQGECPGTSLRWEGMGDEGGLAVASRRFLFTYNGQEYVWMKHRRFSGDNISCQNLSTGNVVAYYTNKMLPKKLQGILVIEPQVQDINLLHTLVAGCLSYREWLERRDMLVWGDSWFSQSVSC